MSETQVAEKAVKSKTVYTTVEMEDGSKHEFPGTRIVDKSYDVGDDGTVTAVFKFRNGAIRRLSSADMNQTTNLTLLGHGIVQKVGDEWSDAKSKQMSVDDVVLTCDEIIDRLKKGEFTVAREGGDSMAGASVVIRAIIEATKETKGVEKTPAEVKAYLDGILERSKGTEKPLTRQALYASFKKPGSRTAAIIERLEKEKLAKTAAVDTDGLLDQFA